MAASVVLHLLAFELLDPTSPVAALWYVQGPCKGTMAPKPKTDASFCRWPSRR